MIIIYKAIYIVNIINNILRTQLIKIGNIEKTLEDSHIESTSGDMPILFSFEVPLHKKQFSWEHLTEQKKSDVFEIHESGDHMSSLR